MDNPKSVVPCLNVGGFCISGMVLLCGIVSTAILNSFHFVRTVISSQQWYKLVTQKSLALTAPKTSTDAGFVPLPLPVAA